MPGMPLRRRRRLTLAAGIRRIDTGWQPIPGLRRLLWTQLQWYAYTQAEILAAQLAEQRVTIYGHPVTAQEIRAHLRGPAEAPTGEHSAEAQRERRRLEQEARGAAWIAADKQRQRNKLIRELIDLE